MSTHRITVQYDARLSFNLNLPADDAALVREQTPIRVVVERVRGAGEASDDSSRSGSSLAGSFNGAVDGGVNGSIEPGAVAAVASPCASYALLLRVGIDGDARDYPQSQFVHRSAAEGAGQCLLQYLASKPQLNVHQTLITEPHRPHRHDHQTYTAVGWSMSKAQPTDPDGAPTVCGRRNSLHPHPIETLSEGDEREESVAPLGLAAD